MNLHAPVDSLKGVGPKTVGKLNKLGIFSLNDLLSYYPKTYRKFEEVVDWRDNSWDQISKKAYKVVIADHVRLTGKTAVTKAVSEGQRLEIIWFHSPYIRNLVQKGNTMILYGMIIPKGKKRILEHPEVYTQEQYAAKMASLQPVYGLTEGITQNLLHKLIKTVLDGADLTEDLPMVIRTQYHMTDRRSALNMIHFPQSEDDMRQARRRLSFDEFLFFILQMTRLRSQQEIRPNMFRFQDTAMADTLLKYLPFKLTEGQMSAWSDVKKDMTGPHVMNRLIQGDVGSGKTTIAMLAMYLASISGYQSCLMAPTEVLAAQHYEKFKSTFDPLGIPVYLLSGSLSEKQKRLVREAIASEKGAMIIGTQALFQEKVQYANLALIITDEQHRFGVKQRNDLADKGIYTPHVLVMSATPIPRTLAIILYSDLDVSQILTKPSNRLPIKNAVVTQAWRPNAYRFIKEQIDAGHQIYVICPMVEANEELDVENVTDYAKKLKQILRPEDTIDVLHGQMKPSEKDLIMKKFSGGETKVLVSTTVVEVGVDVPNATVMLIENAERFGLAQLHQLRGRVGRGADQSYCIFISGNSDESISQRLKILGKSNDGFEIAAQDLRLRGPGDILGIRQSGELRFKIADVFADSQAMNQASEAAGRLLLSDPTFENEENRYIKDQLSFIEEAQIKELVL